MDVDSIKPWLDDVEDYQLASLGDGTLPRKYHIAIRPSTYGRGLFATEAIPEGVCITLYPAHAVGKATGNGTFQMSVVRDIPYQARKEYMLSTPTGDIICGYPEMCFNDWFIGHMVNDPADISCFRKGRECKSAMLYGLLCVRANLRMEWYNGIAMMVTTRRVEANEEFLWSYGAKYWFNGLFGITDVNERIYAFLYKQPKRRREEILTFMNHMPDIIAEAQRLKMETGDASNE